MFEDEIYETSSLDGVEMYMFTGWLDANIGTEFEVNTDDERGFYIMIFDLNPLEVNDIRQFEIRMEALQ